MKVKDFLEVCTSAKVYYAVLKNEQVVDHFIVDYANEKNISKQAYLRDANAEVRFIGVSKGAGVENILSVTVDFKRKVYQPEG